MGNVVVFLEVAPGSLRKASLPAVTFARELAKQHGGKVVGILAAADPGGAAAEAARYVEKLCVFEAAGLKDYLAETFAPLVARVAKDEQASVVCATATNTGKDLLPRVAALLDAGMASDVIAVEGPRKFKRPMLAGNVLAHIEVTTPVVVASVRQTEFPAAE